MRRTFALSFLALTSRLIATAGLINDVVVLDTPTLQLIKMDWVANGGMNTIGGVTLIPLGDDKFKIDIINRHLVGPHGEPVPGPQLMVTLNPVMPGGDGGPEKTSGAHGLHFDVMQGLLKGTAANMSTLYIRFDHTDDKDTVPTIDPQQFNLAAGVPEPGTLWLAGAAIAALAALRARKR